jgi:hypothetical protein
VVRKKRAKGLGGKNQNQNEIVSPVVGVVPISLREHGSWQAWLAANEFEYDRQAMGVNAGGKFIDMVHQNIYRLFCLPVCLFVWHSVQFLLSLILNQSFEVVALPPLEL